MNTYKILLSTLLTMVFFELRAQKKAIRYLESPILTDSASTLMIPTRYGIDFLASNKITIFGDFYANIIFYDFNNDVSKKMFNYDTYISGFPFLNASDHYSKSNVQNDHISSNWLFFLVKNSDRNNNGKIDSNDPTILYATDKQGNKLKQITTADENVVSIHLFEKQDMLMLKVQLDTDKDLDYEATDSEYYFVKLDLKTLTLGKRIESK